MTLDDHLAKTWPVAEQPTEVKPPPDDRLTAFLYILIRDHLPLGVVNKIYVDVEVEPDALVLSNPELAYMARDFARRLR